MMAALGAFLKIFLIVIWMAVACIYGMLLSIFYWGDTSINQYFGNFFGRGALRIAGIQVELFGAENREAHQPCIYTVNHQSLFDLVTFGSVAPGRMVIIGKKELVWFPFFGFYFIAAGNILIDRKKRIHAIADLILTAKKIQEKRVSIWVFPEGTRNHGETPLLSFKKGAFYLAIQAGVPIVPVVCSPLQPLLSAKSLKIRGGKLQVRYLSPVFTQGLKDEDVHSLADKVRSKMLEALRGLVTECR